MEPHPMTRGESDKEPRHEDVAVLAKWWDGKAKEAPEAMSRNHAEQMMMICKLAHDHLVGKQEPLWPGPAARPSLATPRTDTAELVLQLSDLWRRWRDIVRIKGMGDQLDGDFDTINEAIEVLAAARSPLAAPTITLWQLLRSLHFLGLDDTTYYPVPTPYRRFDEMVQHVFQKALEMEPADPDASPRSHRATINEAPQGDSAGENRSTPERAQSGQDAGNDAATKGKCGDSSVSRSAEYEPAVASPLSATGDKGGA